MLMLENFINGKFLPCKNHIDSYDPSTGKVYCKVPDSDQEEVDMAVKAAGDAFERQSTESFLVFFLFWRKEGLMKATQSQND